MMSSPRGHQWTLQRPLDVEGILSAWIVRRFLDSEAVLSFNSTPPRPEDDQTLVFCRAAMPTAQCPVNALLLHRPQDQRLHSLQSLAHPPRDEHVSEAIRQLRDVLVGLRLRVSDDQELVIAATPFLDAYYDWRDSTARVLSQADGAAL